MHEGNLTLERLDLDRSPAGWPDIDRLVVRGNLHVEGSIGNEDTEAACHLMVTGSLVAQSLIVGGQQLVVGRDVVDYDVLWGDGQDGSLMVGGTRLPEETRRGP